jgi:CsoR family transcriptional regulator, copper-sensing transcriptional repressor
LSLASYPRGVYGIEDMKTEKQTLNSTRHDEQMHALARVEGQVRGIREMVARGAYCIDIVTQLQAAQVALAAVGRCILEKHLRHCVSDAMRTGTPEAAERKIEEVIGILKRRRE